MTISVLPRSRSVLQRRQQPIVVALMQADRRLVEDVQHADQRAADLRRQADALRLAAGQRRRRTRERQVVQAHVGQEAQPRANLLDDLVRDLLLTRASASSSRKNSSSCSIDIRVSSSMFRPPTVTASASGFSRAPLQAGQVEADMNFSISSLTYSLEVSL